MSRNKCSDKFTGSETVSGTATGRCATCGAVAKSKYCGIDCYRVQQRSGDIEARFWAKVKIGAPNDCWPWQGSAIGSHGYKYGQFAIARDPATGKSRSIYAHRYVCELTYGPLQPGHVARHVVCDFTLCCNPAHIAPGTQADNLRDASVKGHFKCPRPTAQKVSTSDLADIDRLLATGTPQARIAERYGVSAGWVSQYAKGLRRQYDRPRLQQKASGF